MDEGLFREQGNAPLADTALTKARALLERKRTAEPENEAPARELFDLLTEASRTAEAVPFLAEVSARKPDDTLLAMKVAALQAWFGQDAAYAAAS